MDELPHERVYTRLGRSAIHGVGVIAIVPIAQGLNVFPNDLGAIRWWPKAQLDAAAVEPSLRQLYVDFCINRGDLVGAPVNFNSLSPGWYVNEPLPGAAPNLAMTDDFAFIALRDIAVGEELTAVYKSYSEPRD